jgi:putative membrane protein
VYLPRVIRVETMWGYVWKNALFFLAFDGAVTVAYELGVEVIALPFTPIGTLGMAVAIVVGFHNNSAYDRWCAAHATWTGVVAGSRKLAVSLLGLLGEDDAVARRVIHRRIAEVRALRNLLREIDPLDGVATWLPEGAAPPSAPADGVLNRLALDQTHDITALYRDDRLSDEALTLLLGHVGELVDQCTEVITTKETPLPRQYGFVTQVFVWVFVLLLPMGFMAELGWGTIPLSVLLSITFVTLEQVGRLTENPFDNHMNDVPIDAMTRQVERDLTALLGEPSPPRLEPVRGVLM